MLLLQNQLTRLQIIIYIFFFSRCSFHAFDVCAEVKPRLILERLEDTLLQRGVYHFQLAIKPDDLTSACQVLQEQVGKFSSACSDLIKILPSANCKVFNKRLEEIEKNIIERNEFIETFFNPRSKRGFLKSIGAMDSDDRERLDSNMDTLRRNEENLKMELGHQIEVVNSMYDFLNNSALQMNSRLLTFYSNVANVSKEINEGLEMIDSFSKILVLESNLAELSFLVELVAQNIKTKQSNLIKLLLNDQLSLDKIFDLIEPSRLLQMLDKGDTNLNGRVGFPRKRNGHIYSEILGLTEISHKIVDNSWLQVSLLIPLVDKRIFSTFKALFTPGVKDSVVAILKANEDVLILEENAFWGLEVSESSLKQCRKFRKANFCTYPIIEYNLAYRNSCVAGFYFHNITDYCLTTLFKTSNELWFQSSKSNVWTYVAPEPIKIEITNEEKTNYMNIYGVGNITLTSGMSIRTSTTFIPYNEIDNQFLFIEIVGFFRR